MKIYVETRDVDAVSSDEEIEKLVDPNEKELLLTYMDAVASYLGFIRKSVTAKVTAPKIAADKIMTSAFLHSTSTV